MNEIVKKWEDNQQKLREEGINVKEISNLQEDKKRHNDLELLKNLGGPFTTTEAVDNFVSSVDILDRDKNKRLYLEVSNKIIIYFSFLMFLLFPGLSCEGIFTIISEGIRNFQAKEKLQKSD